MNMVKNEKPKKTKIKVNDAYDGAESSADVALDAATEASQSLDGETRHTFHLDQQVLPAEVGLGVVEIAQSLKGGCHGAIDLG